MPDILSNLAIGRLYDKSGKVVLGTAFAVSSSYALTAFHVIGNRKTGTVTHQQALLEFPAGRRIAAKYVAGDDKADYAILSLLAPLPTGLAPVSLRPQVLPHEPFLCTGYPSLLMGPDITSIGGEVRTESSIFGGVPAIQLFADEAAAGLSLHGMSGSPVLVRNPEAAIGLVRWNPQRTTAPESGVGGIVFCCPVQLIIDKHPELADSVVPVSYENKIAELLPLLAELQDVDREQLSKALAGLHREKLAKNELPTLQPEWTSIPMWQIARRVVDQSEELEKDVIRTIIRTIGRGLEELVPKTIMEYQVVVLLRLTKSDDVWQFSLVCPWQEIVGYLLDHFPPRATPQQMVENLERKTAELYHKYGYIEGALTPIVFQYKPVLRQILATNQNQLNAPGQFLNPHLCRTTSGFLNFIGTFSLGTTRMFPPGTPRLIQFDNFEQLYNSGLGLDQWFNWFYHFIDTGTFFDPNRLFVNTRDSEQYLYHYIPPAKSDAK